MPHLLNDSQAVFEHVIPRVVIFPWFDVDRVFFEILERGLRIVNHYDSTQLVYIRIFWLITIVFALTRWLVLNLHNFSIFTTILLDPFEPLLNSFLPRIHFPLFLNLLLNECEIFQQNLFFLVQNTVLSVETVLNSVWGVYLVQDLVGVLLGSSGVGRYFYQIRHVLKLWKERLKEWSSVNEKILVDDRVRHREVLLLEVRDFLVCRVYQSLVDV